MFGNGSRRRRIFANLVEAIKALHDDFGVDTLWLDGSFVTDRARPGDVDVVYRVPVGADPSTWGEYAPARRHSLEASRMIDLWPYPSPQPGGATGTMNILEFFSSKNGVAKGLVRLNLGDAS